MSEKPSSCSIAVRFSNFRKDYGITHGDCVIKREYAVYTAMRVELISTIRKEARDGPKSTNVSEGYGNSKRSLLQVLIDSYELRETILMLIYLFKRTIYVCEALA